MDSIILCKVIAIRWMQSLYYIKIYELNYITGSHGDLEWLMYYTFCIILQCAYEVVDVARCAVFYYLLSLNPLERTFYRASAH